MRNRLILPIFFLIIFNLVSSLGDGLSSLDEEKFFDDEDPSQFEDISNGPAPPFLNPEPVSDMSVGIPRPPGIRPPPSSRSDHSVKVNPETEPNPKRPRFRVMGLSRRKPE